MKLGITYDVAGILYGRYARHDTRFAFVLALSFIIYLRQNFRVRYLSLWNLESPRYDYSRLAMKNSSGNVKFRLKTRVAIAKCAMLRQE